MVFGSITNIAGLCIFYHQKSFFGVIGNIFLVFSAKALL